METKKSNRPLLVIIIAAVVLVLCICCMIIAAVAVFIPSSRGEFGLNIGPTLSHTESMPVQSFPIESPGKLIVTNPVGDVEIQVGKSNEIVMEAVKRVSTIRSADAESLLERTRIQVDPSDSVLTILVDMPSSNLRGSSVNVNLTITVPPQTELEINQGVGNVDVRGTEGRADVHVEVGDITVNSADLSGNSVLRVNVGNINFSGILEFGEVSMRTEVGDVRLWLPADSTFRLDAETNIGKIDTDFPLNSSRGSDNVVGEKVEGQIGSSSELSLILRTGTGDIELRQR